MVDSAEKWSLESLVTSRPLALLAAAALRLACEWSRRLVTAKRRNLVSTQVDCFDSDTGLVSR